MSHAKARFCGLASVSTSLLSEILFTMTRIRRERSDADILHVVVGTADPGLTVELPSDGTKEGTSDTVNPDGTSETIPTEG
jgi:hypothetical protein